MIPYIEVLHVINTTFNVQLEPLLKRSCPITKKKKNMFATELQS